LSFRNYNADLANVFLGFQEITVALAVLAKMIFLEQNNTSNFHFV